MAKTYTVKAGDTLRKIAEKLLGDADKWKEIYEANRDTIKDPNVIRVGMELEIPGGRSQHKRLDRVK
jgi:nucleoid-associated protein YgaU